MYFVFLAQTFWLYFFIPAQIAQVVQPIWITSPR